MPGEFQGTTTVLEQPKKRTWTKADGWSTVRTWEGPTDAIFDKAVELSQINGAEGVDLTEDGPTATVQATFPDAQDAGLDINQGEENIEWELLGNDLEKDLKTHPYLKPASNADRKGLAAAERASQEATDPDPNWPSIADDYYKFLTQGTTAFILSQYVVRRTIKVSRLALVKASLANVNKVESPLVSGMPSDLLFALPTIQVHGQTTSALEWLKKTPQVRHLGRGKFSIQQEWWGADKWSAALYNGTDVP